MPEFMKKFGENVKKIFGKLTTVQKVIGGAVILAVVVGLIIVFVVNSSQAGIPLFEKSMTEEDFDRTTAKLTEEKIKFTTQGKSTIYVKSKNEKNKALMRLAEKGNMPTGTYSYRDIINSKNLTSSKFMNNVKLREAMAGKLENLLEASELVDKAKVNFTMPEQSIYTSQQQPVKVGVMLTPAYNVNLKEQRQAIKGMQELIVASVDGAELENVTITDNHYVKLNDWTDEEDMTKLRLTKENLKIRNEVIDSYREKIFKAIHNFIPEDRVSVVVDVAMNFDQESEQSTEILPVVLKEDDPNTPYDDGERKYSVTISQRKTSEEFVGPNWIPEGPPGFDDNVPPAYQGALEQMTKYIKNDEILNEVTGERKREKVKDPWEITKITASIFVDGHWEIEYDGKKPVLLENGQRKRKYIGITDEEKKSLMAFVQQGIGFSAERKDKVTVEEFQKDRSAQHAREDEIWKRKQQTTMALIIGLIAIIVLIIGTVIYRLIAAELKRRQIMKEEELARAAQMARDMALRASEEEGASVEMSLEDKMRVEMQENAVGLAKDHPEDVAQVIRTWISEE